MQIQSFQTYIINLVPLPYYDFWRVGFPVESIEVKNQDFTLLHEHIKSIPSSDLKIVILSFEDYLDYCKKYDRQPSNVYWIINTTVIDNHILEMIDQKMIYMAGHYETDQNSLTMDIHLARRNYIRRRDYEAMEYQLKKINQISTALSKQDNTEQLLNEILEIALDITDADSGTLYFLEMKQKTDLQLKVSAQNKQMRFIYTKNRSLNIPFKDFVLELTNESIAGHCALTGKALNIPDAYAINELDAPYRFNPEFDSKVGYKSKSMLVIPLTNHRKEVIGVLQLINKKAKSDIILTSPALVDANVIPFTDHDRELSESFGSQAAIVYENQQLINDLKNQLKKVSLTQRDKIDSLVSLVSGIAHEINNPINFISSSVPPIKADLADIFETIRPLTAIAPETMQTLLSMDIPKDLEGVRDTFIKLVKDSHQIGLDELSAEVESLADIIEKGADRITGIVRSLLIYSSLENKTMEPVDVHHAIDMSIQSVEKDVNQPLIVDKQYGDLPAIESNVEMLHIAFMAILKNAVQAIDPQKGKIIIKTEGNDDFITVWISDNGKGVPVKDRHKIFNPFFTTKDHMGAIGMGLSIASNIINRMNGIIKLEDGSQSGARFIVQLPTSAIRVLQDDEEEAST